MALLVVVKMWVKMEGDGGGTVQVEEGEGINNHTLARFQHPGYCRVY